MKSYDVTICANTKARQLDKSKLKELEKIFKTKGLTYNMLNPQSLQKAPAKNLGSLLVAVGGDGTINAVAGIARKYSRKLAVIPQGTFNHFAKDVGLPQAMEEAAQRAVNGRARRVDTGQVNDTIFLNNSVIGFYPQLVAKREQLQGTFGKWLAAAISIALTLHKLKIYRLQLHINGNTVLVKTTLLIAANNKYDLQNIGLATRDKLDEGKLYVYILQSKNIMGIMAVWMRLLLGRVTSGDFDYYKADHFEITSPKAILRVATDGETSRLKTPLAYKSHHKSLEVIT